MKTQYTTWLYKLPKKKWQAKFIASNRLFLYSVRISVLLTCCKKKTKEEIDKNTYSHLNKTRGEYCKKQYTTQRPLLCNRYVEQSIFFCGFYCMRWVLLSGYFLDVLVSYAQFFAHLPFY